MDKIERYTGKTIEEILDKISTEKKCPIDQITYNVIEEKKGILGIGNQIIVEAYCPNDIKEFIFDYLGNYFMGINIETSIEIREKNGVYKVILDTENNALVIGKNGKTINSINVVLKNACNSFFNKKIIVIVDVGRYKEDRYQRITKTAIRVAKEVSRTKVDVSLDPMPNDERKVIHEKLESFKNIKTESVGEGVKRHLVIKYVKENV